VIRPGSATRRTRMRARVDDRGSIRHHRRPRNRGIRSSRRLPTPAVEQREEASRCMCHEIGDSHVAREDKGNGAGEQTQREQQTAHQFHSDVRRHVVLAGERARRQRQKQRPVADQTGCRSLNHKRRPKSIAGHITYARRVPQSTTHGGFKMPLRKVSLRNPAGSENPAVSPWLCRLI
jgi:hypothetical protein